MPPRGSPKTKKGGGSSQHSPNKGDYSLHRQLQHKIAENELKRFQITKESFFTTKESADLKESFPISFSERYGIMQRHVKSNSNISLNDISLHDYSSYPFDTFEDDHESVGGRSICSNNDDSNSSVNSYTSENLFSGIIEKCENSIKIEKFHESELEKHQIISNGNEIVKNIKTQTNNMEIFNKDPNIRTNLCMAVEEQCVKPFGMQKFINKTDSVQNIKPNVKIISPDEDSNVKVDHLNPTVQIVHTIVKNNDNSSPNILKTFSENLNRISKRASFKNPTDSNIKPIKSLSKRFKKQTKTNNRENDSVLGSKRNKNKSLAPLAPGVKNPKMSPAKFEIKTYSEEHKVGSKNSALLSDAKSKINWFQKQVANSRNDSGQNSVRNSLREDNTKVSTLKKEFDSSFNNACIEKYLMRDQKLLEIYSGYVSDKIKHFTPKDVLISHGPCETKKIENQKTVDSMTDSNKIVCGNIKIYIDIEDSI